MRFALAALLLAGSIGCAGLTPRDVHHHSPQQLFADLSNERSWVREEAARTIGADRIKDGARALEARLLDPKERPWVRAAAADALGAIGDPASLGVLIGLAAAPGNPPELGLAVARALCGYREHPEAIPAIAPLADDPDLLVSSFATEQVKSRCAR